MRYFIDSEFYEKPGSIELISIGIVAEDGREYYAESCLFDWQLCDPSGRPASDFKPDDTRLWLWNNVKPHMQFAWEARLLPSTIGQEIREFISVRDGGEVHNDPDPQFWAWYAAYDWVAFCWLQGRMIDLPKGWPMYCRDLKQVCDQLDVRVPKDVLPTTNEHNALADALELKARFDWVQQCIEDRNLHDVHLLS